MPPTLPKPEGEEVTGLRLLNKSSKSKRGEGGVIGV